MHFIILITIFSPQNDRLRNSEAIEKGIDTKGTIFENATNQIRK